MIRLGVLGSTNGTDLQTILDSIASGELIGEVSVVLSNRKSAHILERAQNHNVPAFFLSHKVKSREEFDAEMTAILKEHAVDLVLLIGFMRILSTKFCQEWRDRLLNVHPSLLPKYAGGVDTNVHEGVLKNGDTETGCTIHFVTDEVDEVVPGAELELVNEDLGFGGHVRAPRRYGSTCPHASGRRRC